MSRSKLRQTCVIIIVTPKYTKVKFNFNFASISGHARGARSKQVERRRKMGLCSDSSRCASKTYLKGQKREIYDHYRQRRRQRWWPFFYSFRFKKMRIKRGILQPCSLSPSLSYYGHTRYGKIQCEQVDCNTFKKVKYDLDMDGSNARRSKESRMNAYAR